MFLYLSKGFHHILGGLDHLAFLLGLILIHSRMKSLLLSISLFTISHCISLILSGVSILNIPANIVEPMIAITVAISGWHAWKITRISEKENKQPSHRYWYSIVFAFGLLSFNIGIELGQLICLVVFLCLIKILTLNQKHSWKVRYVLSSLLLCLGSYWFINLFMTP